MTPIFSVNGNQLTSLTGEVSSFFRILPPDMDGLDADKQARIFSDLESNLVNTDSSFKIYWLDGKLYLNTFGEIDFTHGNVQSQIKPVSTFAGREEVDVRFYENYLTCGNSFLRILSVVDFPLNIEKLESCSWPDFVLNFKKIDKIQAKSKINMKRKLHFSALFKGMRDLDSENAYHQAEELFDAVTSDEKGLFSVEMFFLLKTSTKEELDKLTDKVLYDFRGKGAKLHVEAAGLSHFYQSLIPGVPASFKRSLLVPSDYLSYLVPYHRDFVMAEGFELTSRRDEPVYFDLFSAEALNYNILITGSSGQGKSMMANKLLWQELGRGTKAMVLDLGNSFAKNAKFHNGVILSQKFNPYQFKNPRYLKEFVLATMDDKLSKREEGRLFEEIKAISDDTQVTSFRAFILELEKSFPGIRYYFNEIEEFLTEESLPLNEFTYCDFTLYPEAMKAPLIIYLIEYFKHLEGEKIFIFDECWHLLLKNADYIAECFRTFRKHKASAVAISQNLDDFSESQLGRVIIQNTYFKFLFRQSLSTSEFIDAQSKTLLDSVQSIKGAYSEFLLLTETIKKPIRYYPSPLEYQVMTSAREDNQQFEEYLANGGKFIPFEEAIRNFTQIKNPLWSNT
jgi:TraG P-loop domain